jgi:hypothetical protein
MQNPDPVIFLFYSFPQAALTGIAALMITGIRPRTVKTVLFGLAQALSAILILRLAPAPVLQLLLLILTGAAYLLWLYRLPLHRTLTAMVLPVLYLFLVPPFFLNLIVQNTLLTREMIYSPDNSLLRVLTALPHLILLTAAAYGVYYARGGYLENYRPARRYRRGRY